LTDAIALKRTLTSTFLSRVEPNVLERLPLFSQDLYELIDKHQQLALKQS
jgi:hypothetical protein